MATESSNTGASPYEVIDATGLGAPMNPADMALIAAAPELLTALYKACNTIRAWHGEAGWSIYEENSPEMKLITAAIAKATEAA